MSPSRELYFFKTHRFFFFCAVFAKRWWWRCWWMSDECSVFRFLPCLFCWLAKTNETIQLRLKHGLHFMSLSPLNARKKSSGCAVSSKLHWKTFPIPTAVLRILFLSVFFLRTDFFNRLCGEKLQLCGRFSSCSYCCVMLRKWITLFCRKLILISFYCIFAKESWKGLLTTFHRRRKCLTLLSVICESKWLRFRTGFASFTWVHNKQ